MMQFSSLISIRKQIDCHH